MSNSFSVILLSFAIASGACVGVNAQGTLQTIEGEFVVPPLLQASEGEASLELLNLQQLVTPGAFPALASPIILTAVSFRLDVAALGGPRTLNDLEVALSTNPGEAGLRFVPGPDKSVVFSDTMSFIFQRPLPPGPAPFELTMRFATPFLYTPGSSLLVETALDPSSISPTLDFTESPLIRYAGNGSFFNGGYVMRFSYVVPEPSPVLLATLCWTVTGLLFWKGRFEA